MNISSIFVLAAGLAGLAGMLIAFQTVPPTSSPDIIDTHCHYVPPFYRDLLISMNITAGGAAPPNWNASQHLAMNAELGIKTCVASVSTPGAKLSADAPIEQGRTLARQLNEYGYNLTVDYPGRFKFFATLTLPDLEGAVAEAIYAIDTLGAKGVIILASTFGELLGTRRYDPLYKVLDERKAVIFVHPGSGPFPPSSDFSAFVVDFLLDTTRAALDLVYRNVTTDYPQIKILLAHSGGFLSFAASRATVGLGLEVNMSPNLTTTAVLAADLAGIYIQKLEQMNVDLALSATKYALPSTTTLFSTEHITYGSDYPFNLVKLIAQNQRGYLNYGPFSRKDKERINYKNAIRLLDTVCN